MVRINRSLTLATLLDAQPEWSSRTNKRPILAHFGYLDKSTFTVLNGCQYDIGSGVTPYDVDISNVIDCTIDSKVSFETSRTTNYVDDGWRVLYLGDQTSITAIRRQPKLGRRVMDMSCTLSFIHKIMIISMLVSIDESGFQTF